MKIRCHWNEGMKFTADADGHAVAMDAKRPIGTDSALTPKELVLAGLCGCTAMDVASLMRKYRQSMDKLELSAEATVREGAHPVVFERITLVYFIAGNVDASKLIEAVTLSQTKYCGVTAMLIKAVPIAYEVMLNGERIHRGDSSFD